MAVELFLSYDEHLDWLTLIEFGRVENVQPKDHWRGVSESFGYILRHSGGPEIGFKIPDFSAFDPEDPQVAEIWEGPRFDVPVLGLRDSTAGEIVLAARPCASAEPPKGIASPFTGRRAPERGTFGGSSPPRPRGCSGVGLGVLRLLGF